MFWLARDGDGTLWLFNCPPEWSQEERNWWAPDSLTPAESYLQGMEIPKHLDTYDSVGCGCAIECKIVI